MRALAHRAISAIRDGRIISGIKRRLAADRRRYLRRCKGVIHIGGNDGEERQEYAARGLNVLWVEPLPDAFAILEANIANYRNQSAVMALIADRNGVLHKLHVAEGLGRCSSILKPAGIVDIMPNVRFRHQIEVSSVTLDSVMHERDMSLYDALVIDTQGSELLVLKGAGGIMDQLRYVECEGADFDFYEGYPKPNEIRALLNDHGFRQIREDTFRQTTQGREFDMLFRRH